MENPNPCSPAGDGAGPSEPPSAYRWPRRASEFEHAYCRRLGHTHDAAGTQLCIIDAACLDWLQSRGFQLKRAGGASVA